MWLDPRMHNETELKLVFRPRDVERLRRLPTIAKLASGRPVTRNLVSVYYDTPERRLEAHSTTLRVRRSGRRFVQCVKSGGGRIGGILVRGEHENPVPTEDPVVPAIADSGLRRLIARAGADRLEPVFRTEFKRTSRRLVLEDGGQVMMDLDVGEIVDGEERESINELALELRAGPPDRLFDLALEIHEAVPLRVSVATKAQRGYALLAGKPPSWRKALPLELPRETTVEGALIRIVQHCLDHLLDNEACTLNDDHPEGVHQMRVALRKRRQNIFWAFLILWREILAGRFFAIGTGGAIRGLHTSSAC